MFDNLICLIDAVAVLDAPSKSSIGRQERLASVGSIDSMCSLTMEAIEYKPSDRTRCKIPRKRISLEQTDVLQNLFDNGVHFPSREMRESLSRQLGLGMRTIQVWFQNRRQAIRNRAKSVEKSNINKKVAIRWMKPVVFTPVGNAPLSLGFTIGGGGGINNGGSVVSREGVGMGGMITMTTTTSISATLSSSPSPTITQEQDKSQRFDLSCNYNDSIGSCLT